MGAVCSLRHADPPSVDEEPPDPIQRQGSACAAVSSSGNADPPPASLHAEEPPQPLGIATLSEANSLRTKVSHWAKLRQSFHDGIGGRRSAFKTLRRSTSRLSMEQVMQGGGRQDRHDVERGGRHYEKRHSGSSASWQSAHGPNITVIQEHTLSDDRLKADERKDWRLLLSSLLVRRTRPKCGERAWSALRCFVVLMSCTTLMLLVMEKDDDLDRLVQALAIVSTVSASVLSALAKAPIDWRDATSTLASESSLRRAATLGSEAVSAKDSSSSRRKDTDEGFRESLQTRVGSVSNTSIETPDATMSRSKLLGGKPVSDLDFCSGESKGDSKRSGSRAPSEDGTARRLTADDSHHRSPSSPSARQMNPNMIALARSASQTSLGLAMAIKNQRAVLEGVKAQLEEAEEEVLIRGQMEEEQQTLLRNFRRIVSREVCLAADPPNAMIFVIEEDDKQRASLVEVLREVNCKFSAFTNMAAARAALSTAQNSDRITSSHGPLSPPQTDYRAHCLSRSLHEAEDIVKIVLLGSTILMDGWEVPREWRDGDIFVALTCTDEELSKIAAAHVGSAVVNPTDFEILESLREQQGIGELLNCPVSEEDLRNTIMEALHQHFSEDYLLLQQVGRGSFATVHKAKRMSDGQQFALKEVHLRRMGPQAITSIDQEVQLLRSLRWPTVLFLVDTWAVTDTRYILLPLLPGGDLEGKVQAASRPDNAIPIAGSALLDWYLQTLHGMAYLHWRGVLHTDLKPSNLMLSANSRLLQIGDLGSAVLLPGSGPHPSPRNGVKGDVRTRLYTSPETMEKLVHSCASDLWSIGATFFELLTLKPVVPPSMDSEKMLEQLKSMTTPELLSQKMGACLEALGPMAEELKRQLLDHLNLQHLKRSAAIKLLMPPAINIRLRSVLKDIGAFASGVCEERHFEELLRIHADAEAAQDRAPPAPDMASRSGSRRRDVL